MTKPQSATDQKIPSKYTTFYLVMLILTTVSVSFSVLGISTINTALNSLQKAPLFGGIALTQYVITLLMIVGLVYLYKKKELGLHLLISAYALTTICMILLPLASQPLVNDIATQIVTEGKGQFSMELASSVTQTLFVIIAATNACVSILFAVLWYFAWKKQTKRGADLT